MRTIYETLENSMLARAAVGGAAGMLALAGIGLAARETFPPLPVYEGHPPACPQFLPELLSARFRLPERQAETNSTPNDAFVQKLAASALKSFSLQCAETNSHQDYSATVVASPESPNDNNLAFSLYKEVSGSKVPGTQKSVYELSFTVRDVQGESYVDPADIKSFTLKEMAESKDGTKKDVAEVRAARGANEGWAINSYLTLEDGNVIHTGGEAKMLGSNANGPLAMAGRCVQMVLRNSANEFEAQRLADSPAHHTRDV